jgi:hypothetical protein
MKRNLNFRNSFPHLDQKFLSYGWFKSCREEEGKRREADLASVSEEYPGRDLNPHVRDEHRILSPACLPIPPPGRESLEKKPSSEGFKC